MVLIDAVAGCEEHNLDYFLRANMAVTSDSPEEIADLALSLAHDEAQLSSMRRTMQAANAKPAAEAIYDWLQAHHARSPKTLRTGISETRKNCIDEKESFVYTIH